MTERNATSRTAWLSAVLVLGIAGCSPSAPDAQGAPLPAQESAVASAEGSGSVVEAEKSGEAAAPGFDIALVPVSTVPLGEFPYLQLPAGYIHYTREGSDFDRVAIWTGDRLEWVEGRVFGSSVSADDDAGKTFALLEFQRNMQAAIRQAGGHLVAQGKIPRELRDELERVDDDLGVRYNAGLGDIYNRPIETFVIRRPDREIWIHMGGYEYGGNLLIVETKPVEITAGLLPAAALKQQLADDGRVALQVHFATDRAEILPASLPQIAQVVQLLQADPELALSIEGHTDNTGDAARNRTLSHARATAVVAAITEAGIAGDRLEAAGHGDTRAVADNATEEGRARNRRVELVRRG